MWRLFGALMTRRLVKDFQVSIELAVDRIQQISVGVVLAQAGLLLAIFGIGFFLVGLFFHWSEQGAYVQPALLTGTVALLPSLVCFVIARSLFRRS